MQVGKRRLDACHDQPSNVFALLHVAMTRAMHELHVIAPQRLFTHQQLAAGDRHVYASRTRRAVVDPRPVRAAVVGTGRGRERHGAAVDCGRPRRPRCPHAGHVALAGRPYGQCGQVAACMAVLPGAPLTWIEERWAQVQVVLIDVYSFA
jgi:hypothetical protein